MLSVTYDASASVNANDIDGVLTTYALSDSLTDGTDAISVEAATIIGMHKITIGVQTHLYSRPKVLKGCGMGPWLVLVSPCFRENVVATCKIGSFLCSLDYLLQINVIVLVFGNQISKWRSFEKGLFLTYFSHFLVTREKLQKFLQHISQNIHTRILLALLPFFALPILKKYEFIRYGFSLV